METQSLLYKGKDNILYRKKRRAIKLANSTTLDFQNGNRMSPCSTHSVHSANATDNILSPEQAAQHPPPPSMD